MLRQFQHERKNFKDIKRSPFVLGRRTPKDFSATCQRGDLIQKGSGDPEQIAEILQFP
jgi:hypothetical protein